jgi:adenine/guanine phosphoribosyltransferase-like PRPP-binding protein
VLDRLDGQGRVALGAILGAVVAALCCVGFVTAKDDGPAPAENMLPLALTSEPGVVTGVAVASVSGRPVRTVIRATLTTSGTTPTTTASPAMTPTTVAMTTTTIATTTDVATTTTTTTRRTTTTTTTTNTRVTTRRTCSWLIC